MKPALKYAVLGAGGLALLAGSFVTFAALSGVPLHEIAVLKSLVPAPAAPATGASEHAPSDASTPSVADAHATPPSSATKAADAEHAAVEASVGVLGAFVLPAPFSSNELADLQKALRTSNQDAAKRLERIGQRERELDDWESSLEQRNGELQELRKLLERKELDLSLREDELRRDENAKNAREQRSWGELARFFAEGDPEELAKRLVQFEPKDAVRILRALDDERASALVNALPPDKYHAYLEAYRASAKPE